MPRSRYPALWIMFFMIACGLGYPTLNRYDPSQVDGTWDAQQYFRMVAGGPAAAEGHWRSRVLVPLMARPIHAVADGRVGTWHAVSFSLLIVNAAFCASSAVGLIAIALAFGFPFATGLIAAFAWLLNFEVANFQLAGMVDSAEAFLIIALLFLLQRRAWNALPLLGAIGGLAKETWVPLACLFACGWVWPERRKPWLQLAAMAAAGTAVVVLVRSAIDGHLVTPLQLAREERAVDGFSAALGAAFNPLTAWVTWITFIWLLPFAVRGLARVPRAALSATAAGLAGAMALIVWHDAGSNGARPLFTIAGPYLCLAFAAGAADGFGAPTGRRPHAII